MPVDAPVTSATCPLRLSPRSRPERAPGGRRSSTTQRAPCAGRRVTAAPHRGGLLAGERPVRRPQGQRVRQRPRAGRHGRAGVDVEQPQRLQQLPGAGSQRGVDVRGRARRPSTTSARSSSTGGNAEIGGPTGTAAGGQRVEVELHRPRCGPAARAPRRPAGAARRRGRPPARRRAARRSGRGARAPAPPPGRSARRPRPRRPGGRPAPRRPTCAGRPGAPPAARLAVARRAPRPRARAASGTAPSSAASVSSSGRRSTPGSGAGVRDAAREDRAVLEEREVALPAGEVAGERRQQARAAASSAAPAPPPTAGCGPRPPGGAGRPSGRPRASRAGGPDERVGRRLDVPGLGQRAADAAPPALHVGEPAPGRRGGQHRGDVVVAGEPDDLLDQVGGVGEVGPPGRRGDGQRVAARRRRRSPPRRAARRPGRRV